LIAVTTITTTITVIIIVICFTVNTLLFSL
jgi:hypothetical protein